MSSRADRHRLARDVHDGVQQRLTALALGLALSAKADEDEQSATALALCKQALTTLRRCLASLPPADLDELGLDAALPGLLTQTAPGARLWTALPKRLGGEADAIGYELVSTLLEAIGTGRETSVDVVLNGDQLEAQVGAFEVNHLETSTARERIEQAGGDFSVRQSGIRTTLSASLALPGRQTALTARDQLAFVGAGVWLWFATIVRTIPVAIAPEALVGYGWTQRRSLWLPVTRSWANRHRERARLIGSRLSPLPEPGLEYWAALDEHAPEFRTVVREKTYLWLFFVGHLVALAVIAAGALAPWALGARWWLGAPLAVLVAAVVIPIVACPDRIALLRLLGPTPSPNHRPAALALADRAALERRLTAELLPITRQIEGALAGGSFGADARDLVHELEALIAGLQSSVVNVHGLSATVHALVERLNLVATVEIDLETEPETQVQTVAYYVVSEALTNVVKHAHAAHVLLRLRSAHQGLSITVQDDGRGGAIIVGRGLSGLIERVTGLGGRLEVDSPVGRGTTVRAWLPCAS